MQLEKTGKVVQNQQNQGLQKWVLQRLGSFCGRKCKQLERDLFFIAGLAVTTYVLMAKWLASAQDVKTLDAWVFVLALPGLVVGATLGVLFSCCLNHFKTGPQGQGVKRKAPG